MSASMIPNFVLPPINAGHANLSIQTVQLPVPLFVKMAGGGYAAVQLVCFFLPTSHVRIWLDI